MSKREELALRCFYGVFLVLVAVVAWMFVQDVRTSNYCTSHGKGWHRTERVFSLTPVAVCMQTTDHDLDRD